jgi:uncharacterized membrane protein
MFTEILNNPLFLLPALTGISVSLAGFILSKFPPKEINAFYGYRTKRAKQSQEAWDYAQQTAANQMMKFGGMNVLLSGIAFVWLPTELIGMIIGLVLCLVMILGIFNQTENRLKSHFE